MPKHISKEQKENIIEYYLSKPMTVASLAEKFKICIPSVIKILDEYRIKRYSKVQLYSPDLNEDYFSIIDSPEKAYFLGLIVTDGCLHRSKGKQPLVSITIQKSDDYILNRFLEEINSKKKVTHDGRGCSQVSILSQKMVDSLKKYGVNERKSLCTVFPKNLPAEFHGHFIRGVFDGDGSASYYSRKGRKAHTKAVRFCQGNNQFLIDLMDCLHENAGVKTVSLYREKESLWSIAYRSNESLLKVIEYMYEDASIYIKRKKELCDLIVEEINKYGNTEITAVGKTKAAS